MLKLKVGFSRNIRVEPLIEGMVKPKNIELQFVLCNPGELFYRNLKYDEFDMFEMSFSEYLMTKEKGDGKRWRWNGLPVFLSKAFMWLNLLVNAKAEISDARDLRGKRIGVPDYPMTAALWMRKVFKELYGIEHHDIVWYNGRIRELSHAGILGLDKSLPQGVVLNWLTKEQSLDVMLDGGEIDAAFNVPRRGNAGTKDARNFDRHGGTLLEGNPMIRRLFPDSGRQVITEFYLRTGVVPVNHIVVVQNRVLEENPWVALELYKAFLESKEIAYKAGRNSSATLLFEGDDLRRQMETFGEDPYPCGLKANRKMLEMLVRSSVEQGLTKGMARIEDLFDPSTWST